MPTYRKKLIEVALPLDAINAEAAREKSIRHGHPSTLHLWWARRPLAACRAVLFASLVDDPGNDLPPEEAKKKREELFKLIEQLVKWENTNNETVLAAAREEIRKSTGGNPPPVLDPFCGGGSIPLEAQRLGLEAHASDLNPVAVLITKALIELPPRFRDHQPVNPDARKGMNAEAAPRSALAEDVRWYGRWMRDEAWKRIGHLYPKGPNGETIIAWLWARTVKCPNPACGAQMPLVRSFMLSTKRGKEAWADPILDHVAKTVRFQVCQGAPMAANNAVIRGGTKTGRGANFVCIVCGSAPGEEYIKAEGMQKRLGAMLMAVVAEGHGSRAYLAPFEGSVPPVGSPPDTAGLTAELPDDPRNVWCKPYGLITYVDLFTPRQLVALTTFGDLVGEARARVLADSGGDEAYADATATYLALAVDKGANLWSSVTSWMSDRGALRETFARQALAVAWDFAEANPFSEVGGNFNMFVDRVADVISALPATGMGDAQQLDATATLARVDRPLVCTDPPYYSNISYAVLSDYFYVWLRRSLAEAYPSLFSTMLTPKAQELIATPYRFGGNKEEAERFFENGLYKALSYVWAVQNWDYPMTMFYAFKQAESEGDDGRGDSMIMSASTGWEAMLDGLVRAGFAIVGTWPTRTEGAGRIIALGTNALASSIVLVCRPRPENAPMARRRDFVRELEVELPGALDLLIKGTTTVSPIAPVDLAQAAIGPGMAIFSRYSQVLEASGEPMRVRTALELINREIDRYFSEQEGEQDGPTRFCLAWYRTHGTAHGDYGQAETLSKATVVDVSRLDRMGLLQSAAGKVRLKPASEYPEDTWDPAAAHPLTTWEVTHRLVAALAREGVPGAARIAVRLGGKADEARELAYLLYTEANKRGWASEAHGYNDLVVAWPDIVKAAAELQGPEQGRLM